MVKKAILFSECGPSVSKHPNRFTFYLKKNKAG